MEKTEIKSENLVLTEAMKSYLMDQIHAVFGYYKYKIKKINIKILEDKESLDCPKVICRINIYIENYPLISAEIKTLNMRSAISLAVERAHIKFLRGISDERINRQKLIHATQLSQTTEI